MEMPTDLIMVLLQRAQHINIIEWKNINLLCEYVEHL